MCINFANENLQQFFVQHIFKLEQVTLSRQLQFLPFVFKSADHLYTSNTNC